MSRREYRVIYQREGGQRQYRTFQREPNFRRFLESLTKGSREDLKPIIYLDLGSRSVGSWQTYTIPGKAPQ